MRHKRVPWDAILFILSTVLCGERCLTAAKLGAPDYRASATWPIGWRGDGSGRYPGADPPTHWQRRVETLLRGFRCQAAPPVDPARAAGKPLSPLPEEAWAGHFGICDWLVLGPVPVLRKSDDLGKMLEEETFPSQAELNPVEGQRVGNRVWTRVDSAKVDLYKLFGPWKGRQVNYELPLGCHNLTQMQQIPRTKTPSASRTDL